MNATCSGGEENLKKIVLIFRVQGRQELGFRAIEQMRQVVGVASVDLYSTACCPLEGDICH